ncbi:MAG: hypothetical protein JJT94_09700 [Bernardetiaceae bacterium]|nr:hypothetical protein [Bernardetiaceae bacterium]
MKKIYFLILYLLVFVPKAQTQELIFTSYVKEGKTLPEYMGKEWNVHPIGGGFIYFLYKQAKPLSSGKMYLYIDKLTSNHYYEFDEKRLNVRGGKSWAAFQYSFKEAGKYRVVILNADKEELVTDYIQIGYSTKIIFSESLDSNLVPQKYSNHFKLYKNKPKNIYIFIKEDKPFEKPSLQVKIVRQGTKEDKPELLLNEIFNVDTYRQEAYIKQSFDKPGKYSVQIFYENGLLIDIADFVLEY